MAEKKTGGEQSADSEVLVQVRREIASHLFRTAWLEIAAFSILGIGLCFALGPYASRLRESVWIFLLLIVSAARSAHVYFTDSDAFYSGSRGSSGIHELQYFCGVLASAAVWSVGVLWFSADLPLTELVYLILFTAVEMTVSGACLMLSRKCFAAAVALPAAALAYAVWSYEWPCQKELLIFIIIAAVLSAVGIRRAVGGTVVSDLYRRFVNAGEARRLYEEGLNLRRDDLTDQLTGVGSSKCYAEKLADFWRICSRTSSPLSLLLIDIDYFAKYNNIYGSRTGDACLRKTAEIIRQAACRRKDDSFSRLDGETFALLLPFTDLAGAKHVAGLLRSALNDAAIEHISSGVSDRLTVSVGIATVEPLNSMSSDVLREAAARALKKAKDSGRNQVAVSSAR